MSATINEYETILKRVIRPRTPLRTKGLAEMFLSWEIPASDRKRMSVLAERARAGLLTPREYEEVEAYSRIGSFIGLLKAKARTTLKKPSGRKGNGE